MPSEPRRWPFARIAGPAGRLLEPAARCWVTGLGARRDEHVGEDEGRELWTVGGDHGADEPEHRDHRGFGGNSGGVSPGHTDGLLMLTRGAPLPAVGATEIGAVERPLQHGTGDDHEGECDERSCCHTDKSFLPPGSATVKKG